MSFPKNPSHTPYQYTIFSEIRQAFSQSSFRKIVRRRVEKSREKTFSDLFLIARIGFLETEFLNKKITNFFNFFSKNYCLF